MQTNRTDMTNWLIHFVHKKEEDQIPNNLPDSIEETLCYPYNFSDYTSFMVLQNIIEEAGIRFGYSFRNKKTTLYGNDAVICFSEMPFYNYLQYIDSRNENFVSSYGIAIEKREAFKLGARPVIYGLDNESEFKYTYSDSNNRIIDEKTLPLIEQYRLVNYNPSKQIDWTQEREWRIKNTNNTYLVNEIDFNLLEIPGIQIFNTEVYSGRIIIIVNTMSEAKRLQETVQILLDSNSNKYDTPFNNPNIYFLIIEEYKKINNIKDNQLFKIENLPKECYFQIDTYKTNRQLQLKISNIISEAKNKISVLAANEFIKNKNLEVVNNYIDFPDCSGYSNINCSESNHGILKELQFLGLATPLGNTYQIDAIDSKKIPDSQCLTYHEYIANKVCDYLNEKLDNIFTTSSYMD